MLFQNKKHLVVRYCINIAGIHEKSICNYVKNGSEIPQKSHSQFNI
ncbi:MAG: hypothetical protein BWX65_00387 [Bacteroidetes bacterium ADurb.Bin057]|jgi:hypothetical protein|nr:MAG: hypothetical protein BWX65_00387 [Bacteroidetes bacterium ADurb.Bin057]